MKVTSIVRVSLLLFLVVVVVGCAGRANVPLTSEATKESADRQYTIGAGDNLKVFVWRNPELTVNVPVRPDGKISIPLVEDMLASGKTPTQLARDIEVQFNRYIRDPVVTVIVEQFVGPYDTQIRVIGAATKPQALPYKKAMALLDVMIAVGGLTEFAEGNKAKIIRQVNGRQTEIGVMIENLVQEGDVAANVPMYPGDVLIIPEAWF
ncbi:MAG: wza [Halothiobacillaceae bacterium]|nr:MAG: wza [Halothiobacillaceae bacterium]